MIKLKLYLEEAYNELMNKVTWPTWSDLQGSAIVVMVTTLILSITVYLMDSSFSSLMKLVYKLFY